jgi:hypothetical protein
MPGGNLPLLLPGDLIYGAPNGYPAAPAWDIFTDADVAPVVIVLTPAGGLVFVNPQLSKVFTLTLTAAGWTIQNLTAPFGDGQTTAASAAGALTGRSGSLRRPFGQRVLHSMWS